MRFIASLTILLVLAAEASATSPQVTFKQGDAVVDVSIGSEQFASYQHGEDLPKPFFLPLRGPGGAKLTRPLEDPEDHKHHKGLWVAVDEVNGVKFWAEQGKIVNVSINTSNSSGGGPGTVEVVNHWLDAEGELVVTEATVIRVFPNRLLVYDITFQAGTQSVTFDDTKEGLFAFRMINSMRENETGHVVNAEGKEGTVACWGQPSAWIDYHGTVENQTYGVTLMDHPKNFRKSRYHVRDYGLFSMNPFGQKAYSRGEQPAAPATIKAGEQLHLRYAAYIHTGDTKEGKVAEAYKQFVAAE